MLLLQPSERSSDPGDCRLREARLVLPLTSQEHYSVTGRDFRKKEGGSAASWEAVDPDHISEPFPGSSPPTRREEPSFQPGSVSRTV